MLGWSINLFRVFGIQIAIHVSFLLLLAYYGVEGWNEGGWSVAVWNMVLIVSFFICVLLHELGHSLTAMRYGVRVPRILLLPIGGMAELDHIPRKPSAELLITIMGPAVNVAIVVLLAPFVWSIVQSTDGGSVTAVQRLLFELAVANALMAVFNLLPVFPMD